MKNGIVLLSAGTGGVGAIAQINLRAQIPAGVIDQKSQKILNAASLGWWEGKHGKAVDNVQVPTPQLEESRYVYKDFRALSQIFLSNRGLDFSRPGVLEKSVELLNGKTIFANHDFRDIDNWRGVIAKSWWDSDGKDSGGVPGINVQTMVDAFLNYRTACGLMMNPPAINAASVTVITEVEFSHLDLVKNGTFWDYFLEEVDGEIVRLIATKIIEYFEMSFVFMGEDRLAKPLPGDNPAEDEKVETQARQKLSASIKLNATEKKMKITEEAKTLLGITAEGDDVPEQTVLDAAVALANANKFKPDDIAKLSLNASKAEKLIGEKRTEVLRLAKLAELGADEGTLNPVLGKMINDADVDALISLETLYREKVGSKLPADGQSSLGNNDEIENASGVKPKTPEAKPVNSTKRTKLL